MIDKVINNDWVKELTPYIDTSYFKELGLFLNREREHYKILPNKDDIFNSFKFTPYSITKIMFCGLDPYIREEQAYGISFGIPEDCMKIPPSLGNIYKELESDIHNDLLIDFDYSLKHWCDQGCFMYNTSLTVREGKTGTHLAYWKLFTEGVFKALNNKEFMIYVLLGRKAQEYQKFIEDKPTFHIIKAPHPAAESYAGGKAGFFGSKIFSKINTILKNNNYEQINW